MAKVPRSAIGRLEDSFDISSRVAGDMASARNVIGPVVLLNGVFILAVLLLHHGSYTHDYIWRLRPFLVDKYLQKLAVGGFLFLSGYKLTESKLATTAKSFLINRFTRIYPPYFLSLVVYSFTDYPYKNESLPSLKNFVLHVFLLQSVLPDFDGAMYRTLWFVSLLFCCYLLFLATRKLVHRASAYLLVTSILVLGIGLVRYVFAGMGVAVFLESFEVFVSFFSMGMLYSAHKLRIQAFIRNKTVLYRALVAVTAALFAIAKFYLVSQANTAENDSTSVYLYYFNFIAILMTTIPVYLLFLSGVVTVSVKNKRLHAAIQSTTVASFFVFLFHRPIWAVLGSLWYNSGFVHSLYIFGVGLPLIFGLSYWGQTAYTRLLRSL